MNITPLTADQKDALQEVLNIAMGQAGASLALLLDSFIELSVPRIRIVNANKITETVMEMVGDRVEVTAVRQAFFDDLRGEAIVIFEQNGCKDLADLMGYQGELNAQAEQELLLDVTNVLVGAILNGITETLGTELSYSAPSVIAEKISVKNIINQDDVPWTHALLLEVNYNLKDRDFQSHLLLLLTEEAIAALCIAIDKFLETI